MLSKGIQKTPDDEIIHAIVDNKDPDLLSIESEDESEAEAEPALIAPLPIKFTKPESEIQEKEQQQVDARILPKSGLRRASVVDPIFISNAVQPILIDPSLALPSLDHVLTTRAKSALEFDRELARLSAASLRGPLDLQS
jgi:hypothetical protein